MTQAKQKKHTNTNTNTNTKRKRCAVDTSIRFVVLLFAYLYVLIVFMIDYISGGYVAQKGAVTRPASSYELGMIYVSVSLTINLFVSTILYFLYLKSNISVNMFDVALRVSFNVNDKNSYILFLVSAFLLGYYI